MAQAETLTYRFQEEGLDELRSDMQDLAQDTEEVGSEAQDAAGDLEEMGDTAAQEVPGQMDRAQRSVEDVGEEAADAASGMERQFTDASETVQRQIESIQGRLEGLDSVDIGVDADIAGNLTSSTIGAAVGAGGAGALAGAFTDARRPAAKVKEEVEEVGAKAQDAKAEIEKMGGELEDSAKDAGALDSRFEDVGEEAFDAANQVEDIGGILGGGGGDGGGDLLGGLGDQLGGLAGKARMAALAFGPLRTAILAAGAAAATQVPRLGQLSRELQNAAANASRLPSEIQQVANAQELLTGRQDVEEVGEVFKEFNLRMREAQEGAQEAQEGFKRLGISMDQLGEMTPNEAFQLVIRRLRKASKEQRALTREQVLGGEAAERFALMTSMSAEELKRLNQVAEETTFSGDQISRFAAMGRELDSIGMRLKKLGGELLGIFEPVFSTILKLLDELLRGITFVFDKIEDGVRSVWSMMQELDSELFGTERRLEFNYEGGEGTDSRLPEGGTSSTAEQTPQQQMGQALNQQAKQIGRIRERYQKGLIDKEQMVQEIVSARESAFQELQRIGQEAPGLVTDELMTHLSKEILKLRNRLEREVPAQGVGEASQVEEAGPAPVPVSTGISVDAGEVASKMQQRAANLRRMYEEQLSGLQRYGKAVGEGLKQSLSRAVNSGFRALGQGVAGMLFGGGGGQSTAQARLNLFNAKGQVRSMKKALRKGQMSYRKFSLQMQVQQNKIQRRQDQLNDSMKSGFAKAASSMAQAFKQVAKQLIAEITAVVAKMAVLKAITSAFTISSGGFGGAVISQLGGGAFLDSAATGGTVGESGIAEIHKGEEIVPSQTVDTLRSLTQPSNASVQPAMTGQSGAIGITVNVEGETRTDGRDLKTSYDSTTRVQRRKGRS